MGSQWKCFKWGSVRKTCRIRSIPPPDEEPKNGAAPRSHFIFSLHWKTDLPFVSQEILFFFLPAAVFETRTTATFPVLGPDIAVRQPGRRPAEAETQTIVALIIWMSYLSCICSRLHFKAPLGRDIVRPPSASSHRARGHIHESKRINRAGARVLPPSSLPIKKKRKTRRPWGLSINREQSQWPFCLC